MSALARALVAAARVWGLYPPEHPAVRTAVDRFAASVRAACDARAADFGVTPDTLLVNAETPLESAGPVAEAAAWLHGRDILHIAFDAPVPADALEALLRLLAEDPAAIRQAGGPAVRWTAEGHPSVRIEQMDLDELLEDPDAELSPSRKDDLWRSIVQAVLDRRRSLDPAMQERLLEIAGDVAAIGALAEDVMAPNCAVDGSPMLTSQAAAVVAVYRHLLSLIDVMAPDRRAEVLQNLAGATAALDPRVVMQIFAPGDAAPSPHQEASAEATARRAVADVLDDEQVAQLLATTLALDGRASDRLASVFSTIAPDESRRARVLTMTREALRGSALAQGTDFKTLWTAMEELLLSYSEKPFVSADYRDALDGIHERAARMATDVPEELAALIDTLAQENVRRLSVTLLLDLLNLERDGTRAPELAADVGAACEDLLLAGDYASAAKVAGALADRAADAASPAAKGARAALEALAATPALKEAAEDMASMDEASAAVLAGLLSRIGPAATDALLPLLALEAPTEGRTRATAIVRGFGPAAIGRLAPLTKSPDWFTQRNVSELLGDIGTAGAVPLLQPLLRGRDPRVVRAAVRALSTIEDPSAGRSIHTVLRATTGDARQAVVAALVERKDARVVPLLGRILDDSDALGEDHGLVLETLEAIGAVGGDAAIPAVERVMRKRKWYAGGKVRAIVDAAVRALRQVGTPAATAALARAAEADRVLRRVLTATEARA